MPMDVQPTIDKKSLSDNSNVVKDRIDTRDIFYKPTLNPLKDSRKNLSILVNHPGLVRNQFQVVGDGPRGTCTAQALAAVIDILRSTNKTAPPRASADMLYHHGRDIESQERGQLTSGAPEAGEGLWSLRSTIKALYHNGVCPEQAWIDPNDIPEGSELKLVNMFKEARKTPLGSYYRLNPILNDYHAALNEVGVIYAAAEVHDGWHEDSVRENGGRIEFDDDRQGIIQGNHAFAIVGYTPEGFLVLNSWGPKWGEFKAGGRTKVPGVALWPYKDWAERILDGWVLRLGVSAPEAFRYSFGRQGLGDFVSGQIAVSSTPRHELMGHYIHMDDGKLVANGAIPSTAASLTATCRLIEDSLKKKPGGKSGGKPYTKLLLWIPGGSEGTKETLHHIASTKDIWRQKGVYPLTVLWCANLLDQASTLIGRLADQAFERVGRPGAELDVRIERETRAIGKAVWRDVHESARLAAREDEWGDSVKAGAMNDAFKELNKLPTDVEIHLVAEGGGAVLAHQMLAQVPEVSKRIASLTLVLPACSVAQFKQMRDWLNVKERPDRLKLILASESVHKRMCLGNYGGSILDLIQWAFVEEPPVRATPVKKDEPVVRSLIPVSADPKSEGLKTVPEASRTVGLMLAAEARRVFYGLDIEELSGPPGEEKITQLRLVSAGKQARDMIQKSVLKEAAGAGQPEIGSLHASRPPAEIIELRRMPNGAQMPAV